MSKNKICDICYQEKLISSSTQICIYIDEKRFSIKNMPSFYCKKCNEHFVTVNLINKINMQQRKHTNNRKFSNNFIELTLL